MDAYDVLLFPDVALAPRVLAASPAPILFCADFGYYPDYGGEFYIGCASQQVLIH